MSKQEDELRELFVKYGYPRITEAELNLIPAISTYISTHYISKAGVLRALEVQKIESRLDEALFVRYNRPQHDSNSEWMASRIAVLQDTLKRLSK